MGIRPKPPRFQSPQPGSIWAKAVGAAFPAAAALATFLPWLRVGVGSPARSWTAYAVTPWTWAWLACDALALISKLAGPLLDRPSARRYWRMVGAVSFGTGLTIGQAVRVSARVSQTLGAPNPVHLAAGVLVFVMVAGLWTAAGLIL